MHENVTHFNFTRYFSRVYCKSIVDNRRLAIIDDILGRSNDPHVISYKYEEFFNDAVSLKWKYYRDSSDRLKEAIDINTFKLQTPLLFIGPYSTILQSYYEKIRQENDKKIRKLFMSYKIKRDNQVIKSTKPIPNFKDRKTIGIPATARFDDKIGQPILGKYTLKNQESTLVNLVEELQAVKRISVNKLCKLDLNSKSRPKIAVCLTGRNYTTKNIRKRDSGSEIGHLKQTSNPEKYLARVNMLRGIIPRNKVSKKSKEIDITTTCGKKICKLEKSNSTKNNDDEKRREGIFEISSITLNHLIDKAYTVKETLNCPHSARTYNNKQRNPELQRPLTLAKRQSAKANFSKPIMTILYNQEPKLGDRVPFKRTYIAEYKCSMKAIEKLAPPNSLAKKEKLNLKLNSPRSDNKKLRRATEFSIYKQNEAKIPLDLFKKELKLNLPFNNIHCVSKKITNGFNSDRAGSGRSTRTDTVRVLCSNRFHKKTHLGVSKEETPRRELDKKNNTTDVRMSIFKFKR